MFNIHTYFNEVNVEINRHLLFRQIDKQNRLRNDSKYNEHKEYDREEQCEMKWNLPQNH